MLKRFYGWGSFPRNLTTWTTAFHRYVDEGGLKRKILFSTIFLGLGVGGLAGILMTPLSSNIFVWLNSDSNASSTLVFQPTLSVSHQQARNIYKKSLEALKQANYPDSLKGFQSLEPVYPGLQEFLLFHQVEVSEKQGNELATQRHLKNLLSCCSRSSLIPLARYRLAQSHFRAQELTEAKQAFEVLRKNFPETPYGMGSLYYLGSIALQPDSPEPGAAIRYWKEYLQKTPEGGRFSVDIAKRIEPLLGGATPDELRLLANAYYAAGENWEKASSLFQKIADSTGREEKDWLPLGKSLVLAGKTRPGLETLLQGLLKSTSAVDTQEAVDLVQKYGTPQDQAALLSLSQPLLGTSAAENVLLPGGDYLLWLASQKTPHPAAYYEAIVNRYPTGDYAPESSWQLLWPWVQQGVRSNGWDSYLSKSKRHLALFPSSRSASKVLFWQAKAYDLLGSKKLAEKTYRSVLHAYPDSYYAYRAGSHLMRLENQPENGWETASIGGPYPPSLPNTLSLLNYSQASPAGFSAREFAVAKELEAIPAGDDLALLFQESSGKVPELVRGWQKQLEGSRDQSIRIVRDDILGRIRHGGHAQEKLGIATPAELQLLYPVYFQDKIQQEASTQFLNPYLVQSLMREESYFNAYALSSSKAMGLMQLLPSTAKEVALEAGLKNFQPFDLFKPAINIKLGTRYLSKLHKLFQGNSMLAVGSYNGGPNAMKRWVQDPAYLFHKDKDYFVEAIPYEQTRDYIKKVFGSFWNYHRLYAPQALPQCRYLPKSGEASS